MPFDITEEQKIVSRETIALIEFLNKDSPEMKVVPQSYYNGKPHTHSNDPATAKGTFSVGIITFGIENNSCHFIIGVCFYYKCYCSCFNGR